MAHFNIFFDRTLYSTESYIRPRRFRPNDVHRSIRSMYILLLEFQYGQTFSFKSNYNKYGSSIATLYYEKE